MNYFSTDVATLADFTFRRSSFVDRGIWITLISFCSMQENGGRIKDFEQWSDHECIAVLGISKDAIAGVHHLWEIKGSDLVVWRYPKGDESALSRTRLLNSIKQKLRHAQDRLNQLRITSTGGSTVGSESEIQAAEDTVSALRQELHTASSSQVRSGQVRSSQVKSGEEKKVPETPPARKGKVGSVHFSEVTEPIRSRLIAINEVINRRDDTRWSAKEFAAFNAAGLGKLDDESFDLQVEALRTYYRTPIAILGPLLGWKPGQDFHRQGLEALLNNWGGEVDRSHHAVAILQKNAADEARLTGELVSK